MNVYDVSLAMIVSLVSIVHATACGGEKNAVHDVGQLKLV